MTCIDGTTTTALRAIRSRQSVSGQRIVSQKSADVRSRAEMRKAPQ